MGVVTSLFAHKMVAAAGPEVDAAALLTAVGLDPEAEADPKKMLPDTAYYGLLEQIAEAADVTTLPVRVGASMRCDEYGALGLAWKAAPTIGGSFARVERYARLWTDVVGYELREIPKGMLYLVHRDGPRRLGMRLSNEATLASTVSLCRQVSPVGFVPLEVRLRHPAPRDISAHEAYFRCPMRFDAEHDALLLEPRVLTRPNRLGDRGITAFLESHLDAELQALVADDPLKDDTKAAIARSLSEGVPRMGDVARGMGMSARSFHRRLSEHGLSFQLLTEETRRELAEGLLKDARYSLAEVAFLTGFAEQSSFTRAFKRWVGRTPARYRRGL